MQIQPFIEDFLSKTTQPIHQKRATILAKMVISAVTSPKDILLTNLGRNLDIQTSIKHKIKTADRLIGNKKLHSERKTLYQALSQQLLANINTPVIIIDWSPLSADQEQQLLRAAIALDGKRSIALYEEVHSRELLGNREIQNLFLETLKYQILPKNTKPIIIADSGFRVPFYKQVTQLGWHWLGRIRNRDFIAYGNGNRNNSGSGSGNGNSASNGKIDNNSNNANYFGAKDLYTKATQTPQTLGDILWAKNSKLAAQLFLYHKAAKNRIDKDLKGNRRKAKSSRKQASRESEPWLLVASKSLNITAKQAVKYYTSRRQIETGFREAKSPYYGLGLTDNSRIKPYRYENLLIIVALAMFVLWIIGNGVVSKKNA